MTLVPIFDSGGPYAPCSGLELPLGVDFVLTERVSLTVELTYLHREIQLDEPPYGDEYLSSTLAVTAGPSLYLTGAKALAGLFVRPKLIAACSRRSMYVDFPFGSQTGAFFGGSIEAGLDIGYSWRLGPVLVSPIVGASAGIGFRQAGPFATFELPDLSHVPKNQLVWDLNLNLVRLGVTF